METIKENRLKATIVAEELKFYKTQGVLLVAGFNNPNIEAEGKSPVIIENIRHLSDGYHTFDELYEFRKMYNAVLFNEWSKNYMQQYNTYKDIDKDKLHPEIKLMLKNLKANYNVHKSWKHHDGEECFGGGWFIVSAMLPTGLISNHYKMEDWGLFKVPEVEKALYEFDEHTGADVLQRLKDLTR